MTLSAAETVTQRVSLINGTFNNGAFLTLADNATIARDNGVLQSVPTYSGNINVEYFGTNTITTGIELPTGFRLNTLTMNKTGGATVTLDKDTSFIKVALTLTSGNLITTTNFTVQIANTGTSTGSTASYVIGTIYKYYFNSPNPFTYHVGTANGYSPMTLNVDSPAQNSNATTNVIAGLPSFSVSSSNGVIGGLDPAKTLNRFWTLNSNGISQGDITFQYPQADVPGTANEYLFRFVRQDNGSNAYFTPSALNTTTNVATLNDVTQFSNWTLTDLGPTAATADIGGSVTRADGSPLAGVRLQTVGSSNNLTATTDNSGRYSFPEMAVGQTYVITPSRRRLYV